jgi:hypothetical protein
LSDYNDLSDTAETYHTEDPKTSADELVFTLYLDKEPETFDNRLVFTLFLYSVDDDISADELDYTTYTKPAASKRSL